MQAVGTTPSSTATQITKPIFYWLKKKMAGSKVPVKSILLLCSRRTYTSAAPAGVRKAMDSTATHDGAVQIQTKKEKESERSFWMKDPKTGNWIPEAHFDDIDVVALREKFLPRSPFWLMPALLSSTLLICFFFFVFVLLFSFLCFVITNKMLRYVLILFLVSCFLFNFSYSLMMMNSMGGAGFPSS